jgi:hypothetical protein
LAEKRLVPVENSEMALVSHVADGPEPLFCPDFLVFADFRKQTAHPSPQNYLQNNQSKHCVQSFLRKTVGESPC